MNAFQDDEYFVALVRELCRLPYETEWVEFKVNLNEPNRIGEYISALANAAVLHGRDTAYLVWGIADLNHEIVGTEFSPKEARKGNEPLETWLSRLLVPHIPFSFHEIAVEEKPVTLLIVGRANQRPISFSGTEFIRVGSAKKKLKDYPEKERNLWRIFDQIDFEDGIAAERVQDKDVLGLLNYSAYFELSKRPLPDDRSVILDLLKRDELIATCPAGGWNITNLGAILFAKNLQDFPRLKRKAVRVIQYTDRNRTQTLREKEILQGYASGFEALIDYILALLPVSEVIEHSLRQSVLKYPFLAVRELVANMLIHQDFAMAGAGPMVELFEERIEITNPGQPLVDTDRFLDAPPRSRNETVASMMRRFGICEERGSGIDKVVLLTEMYQLPAPRFESPDAFTRVVLSAHKSLSQMDKKERVWACYLHACLHYVSNTPVNNTSLRQRFNIKKKNAARASQLLKEALEAELLIIRDPAAGAKNRTYLPYWAHESN